MENLYFRKLMVKDYNSNYFELLNQLSNTINISKFAYDTWVAFINNLNANHQIIVLIDKTTEKIVASGTIIIERKIIHNMGNVAHIEDIVVDKNCRGNNIGKELVIYLLDLAKEKNVYKVILDCFEKNTGFYEKCGFVKNGIQMVVYK